MVDTKSKNRRGRDPEKLILEDDWRTAVGKALKKKRPKEGWPDEKTEEKKKG